MTTFGEPVAARPAGRPPEDAVAARPVGRPPEDAVARRRAIFAAVVPLIADGGARRLTMARAARTAHLSVGGLYHRFDSKQALLLYGIAPENLGRACADFTTTWGHLAATDPPQLLARALDGFADAAQRWVRPSVDAAGQLGIDVLRGALDDALATELVGMVRSVRAVWPDLPDVRATALERALRRTVASVVVDPEMTAAQLRDQLRSTVLGATAGLVPVPSPVGSVDAVG